MSLETARTALYQAIGDYVTQQIPSGTPDSTSVDAAFGGYSDAVIQDRINNPQGPEYGFLQGSLSDTKIQEIQTIIRGFGSFPTFGDFTDIQTSETLKYLLPALSSEKQDFPEVAEMLKGSLYVQNPAYGHWEAFTRTRLSTTDGYLSNRQDNQETGEINDFIGFIFNVRTRIDKIAIQAMRDDAYGMTECLIDLLDSEGTILYTETIQTPLSLQLWDVPVQYKSSTFGARLRRSISADVAVSRFDPLTSV